jgi:CBS domain-containing protein
MATDVETVRAGAPLLEAFKLMINSGASALPVVDDKGNLVGMLSEHDVIQQVLEGEGAFDLQKHLEAPGKLPDVYARALAGPASALMSKPAISATEDTRLKAIADLMVKHRVHNIPVVREGSVVGMVNRVSLVKALLSRSDVASSPRAASPAEVDDEKLRTDVVGALRRLGLLLGGGFDVVARHGTVHLWGQAYDEEDHRSYLATAAKVPGVRDVLSHMQVVPPRGAAGYRR